MYNRKYDKKFIILSQDLSTQGEGVSRLNGSCVLEIRNGQGIAEIQTRGLQKLSKGKYYVYFVSHSQGKSLAVNMGSLEVDEKGIGKKRISFQVERIGGAPLSIEEIHAVVILVRDGVNQNSMAAPLVGYTEERVNWKVGFEEYSQEKEKNSVIEKNEKAVEEKEEALQKVAEETFQEEVEEAEEKETTSVKGQLIEAANLLLEKDSDKKEEKKEAEITWVCQETILEPLEDSITEPSSITAAEAVLAESLEEQPQEKESQEKVIQIPLAKVPATEADFYGEYREEGKANGDMHDTFRTIARRFHEELNELEKLNILTPEEKEKILGKNQEKEVPQNDVEQIFQYCKKVTPFKEMGNVQWACISDRELGILPYMDFHFINHPFLLSGYRKYKHLILGRQEKEGKTLLILGVPDVYSLEYQKKGASLGFHNFQCCEEGSPNEGKYGYWLMTFTMDEK